MATSNLQQQLRNGRAISVVGLVCTFMLVSAASRNQRALFPTEPFGLSAAAFTAVPDAHTIIIGGLPGGRNYFVSAGRRPAPFGAGPGGAPLIPGLLPGAPPIVPQFSAIDGASPLDSGSDIGVPQIQGVPGTILPGGGAAGTDGDTPAPAVPEPSTWLMVILGVSMIGGALRWRTRRRPSSFGRRALDRSAAISIRSPKA